MSTVALRLEEIIGAPLRAMIEAQRLSTEATLNFLMSLTRDDQGKRILESMDIIYQRMVQDPDQGIKIEKQSLSVPLLTLVPIPYINIDEGEINLNIKIVSVRESKDEKPYMKSIIHAIYAGRNVSTSDLSGEMNIKIKVKRNEMPEGLAKVLTVVSDGITIKEEKS